MRGGQRSGRTPQRGRADVRNVVETRASLIDRVRFYRRSLQAQFAGPGDDARPRGPHCTPRARALDQAAAGAGCASPACAARACARLARPDTSSAARIAPATANTAPTVNAAWKPSVSAPGGAWCDASELVVTLFAIVARMARPSAPPICWDVLISPEASPSSCGSTPDTAATVIETNAKPSPTAASRDGNRMSPTYVPVGETWENKARPAAVSTRPTISTGLKPNRVPSPEAIPAETMIPPASGRYERPAFSAS